MKILLGIIAFATVANAVYFINKYHAIYDLKCESYLTHQIGQDNFSYSAMIGLELRNDAKGTFSVEGVMRQGGKTWVLNRDVVFEYTGLHDNTFRMKNIHIVKYGRDHSPDDLFDKNVLSLKDEASRVMSLAKVKNGYIVGTLRAPALICIPH
ncbi:hypothetical protein EGM70_11310 [Enterobacteriaceae bacterium 89]|nr:hypothetical protein [Enterobacteriaceae bacterium 89]